MSRLLNEGDARGLTDRILKAAKKAGAGEASVSLRGSRATNVRFARNGITTNGEVAGNSVSLSVSVGKKTASVETNKLDDASLNKLAASAVANAKALPDDPEHMPALGPQRYADIDAYFDETAKLDAGDLAESAGKTARAARDKGVVTAGYAEATAGFHAIANTAGLFGYHRATGSELTATTRTQDGTGSGWASSYSRKASRVDAGRVARGSIDRAIRSQKPQALDPGTYPVILEPEAVSNILGYLGWVMNQRSADEGRSFFSKPGGKSKVGERIWNTPITVSSDPGHALTRSSPFAGDGRPVERTTWIDKGVVKALPCSRYWAQKTGAQSRPRSRAMLVQGEGSPFTLEEMVQSAKRAILVTRLWYIRMVDPRQLLLTGLTRDGTFLVEDGKITRPLKNFRFNESPIEVMKRAQTFTAPVEVGPGRAVPALSVSGFRFSSVSEAV
jgi:predicted Zn-dependent protease